MDVIFFNQQKLNCVIFVVSGTGHTFVKPWKSYQTRFLLFVKILRNQRHDIKPAEVRMCLEADNIILHFFQNFHALFII